MVSGNKHLSDACVRIAYLGNLPEIARQLAELTGVELVACLVEDADAEAVEIENTFAGTRTAVYRVRDRRDVKRALKSCGPITQALMANFGIILDNEILSLPAEGVVNAHFGILPAYPGRNPLLKALANGERVVGVTLHRVTDRIDAGPVLDTRTLAVGQSPMPYDVFMDMRGLAKRLLSDHLSELAEGRSMTSRLRDTEPGRKDSARTMQGIGQGRDGQGQDRPTSAKTVAEKTAPK